MTLAEALAVALMALPCPRDEPADQCQPWRATVAEAIAEAAEEATCSGEWAQPECKPAYRGAADELAAHLVEIGHHESGFRRRIQAGDCRLDECDHHRGVFLARSMWQIHRTPELPRVEALVPRRRWLAIQGTAPEAVRLAARTAARVLVSNPSAFGVTLRSVGKRGQSTQRILARIRAATAPREATE